MQSKIDRMRAPLKTLLFSANDNGEPRPFTYPIHVDIKHDTVFKMDLTIAWLEADMRDY